MSRPPASVAALAEATDDGAPAWGAGPDDVGAPRRRPMIGADDDEARARAKTAWGQLAEMKSGSRRTARTRTFVCSQKDWGFPYIL